MSQVIKPPHKLPKNDLRWSVFLAGSIEQGMAEDWQKQVETALEPHDVLIFNPRRDDWDWTWEQRMHNPQFNEQVNWELDALEQADVIAMYFSPGTKSPISLLEFGMFADQFKLIVCCPDAFWRKGNVEIVCHRNKIPLYDNKEEWIKALVKEITGPHLW